MDSTANMKDTHTHDNRKKNGERTLISMTSGQRIDARTDADSTTETTTDVVMEMTKDMMQAQ